MSELRPGDFVAITPLTSAFVRRFDAALAVSDAPPPESAADAHARGWAEGFAAADAARTAIIAACDRIAAAVADFDAPPPRAAATALAGAMAALISQIVGDAPVDHALLAMRCADALALAGAAAGPVVLMLAPGDADAVGAVLAETHPALAIAADPALLPGSVRVEHGDGAVVHGSAALLADLCERWQGAA
ncbi:MAG: hypothetical protein RLZZ58_980 [Pseudomonadota bacterium]